MPKYENGRPIHQDVSCRDGFSMSVQVSERHYCSPRNNSGPWDSVEVGFPTAMDMLLRPYADDPTNPTETVYGYVPSKIILAVVDAHGGLINGEIPELLIEEKED